MNCIFSLEVIKLSVKNLCEFQKEDYYGFEYSLNSNGEIIEIVSDNFLDIIENPNSQNDILHLINVRNYDGALNYDIEELSIKEVFDGFNFLNIFKNFDIKNMDDDFKKLSKYYFQHIHIIVSSRHWKDDYDGEYNSETEVVGYLDKDCNSHLCYNF